MKILKIPVLKKLRPTKSKGFLKDQQSFFMCFKPN